MPSKPAESLIAASQWYALLSSDVAKAEDFETWQRWKDANTENKLAWQRIEDLSQRISSLPSNVRAETFAAPSSFGRRQALKQMAVMLGIGTFSILAYRHKPWREALADYSTATGEIRDTALPDGSRMFLNTASAVDIRFSPQQRLVELVKGEVLIHTAHENGDTYRPFILATQHGNVTALGTKFSVRDLNQSSRVSVSEGAVKVAPANGNGNSVTIHAGQSVSFDSISYTPMVEQEVSSSWSKGLLVVYSMPLGEFIEELSRYRSGLLRCDPAVRHLLVSGSFLTADTDAILENLTRILQVRVESLTPYWVTIHPA